MKLYKNVTKTRTSKHKVKEYNRPIADYIESDENDSFMEFFLINIRESIQISTQK